MKVAPQVYDLSLERFRDRFLYLYVSDGTVTFVHHGIYVVQMFLLGKSSVGW